MQLEPFVEHRTSSRRHVECSSLKVRRKAAPGAVDNPIHHSPCNRPTIVRDLVRPNQEQAGRLQIVLDVLVVYGCETPR